LIKLHIRADLLLYSLVRPGIKDLNLRCVTGIPQWRATLLAGHWWCRCYQIHCREAASRDRQQLAQAVSKRKITDTGGNN
jgi:hypothetical protein